MKNERNPMTFLRFSHVLLLAAALTLPTTAGAEPPPEKQPSENSIFTKAPYLTPNSRYTSEKWWDGNCALCFGVIGEKRQELYDQGIAIDLSLTQYPQGVVAGGREKEWEYGGNADYYLAVDSDRLGLWPGGLLGLHGKSKFGHGVFAQSGVLSPVNYNWLLPSSKDGGASFLTEYYIMQGVTDWLLLGFGRFQFGNIGDTNTLAGNEQTQFVNTSLKNSPLLGVIVGALSLHGAFAMIQPNEHIMIAPFVLSRNDEDDVWGSPGGLFSEYSAGGLIDLKWTIAGLPGELQPLGAYTNHEKLFLDDNPLLIIGLLLGQAPEKSTGNWVVGFSGSQYFYVPKEPSKAGAGATPYLLEPEGIGAFMRFHYSPENRNVFNMFVSGGLGGRGVIPTRPLDRYGIGFYGLFVSDDFKSRPIVGDLLETEWGMEVFYNVALTPWLQFSPSVQYVRSGLSNVKDSVIVTTRLQLYF
jgi:porin